jgi:hypothetical protein
MSSEPSILRGEEGSFLSEKYYRDFKEYIGSCGINIVESFPEEENYKEPMSLEAIFNHLKVLSEFHKKTMGVSGFNVGLLENNTGKKVEQFKVYIKKLKRDIKRLVGEKASNSFEVLLLEKAQEYLERAEKCVRIIYDNGYYKLIERSMKRNEVCLGSTYINNIRKNEQLNIRNIKKCCYNMVEFDAIHFLGKLKKKGYKLDFKAAISEFCKLEALPLSSEIFINAVLSYPVEFMKYCERYRYGKKEWNEDEYAKRLLGAMGKDGVSLL